MLAPSPSSTRPRGGVLGLLLLVLAHPTPAADAADAEATRSEAPKALSVVVMDPLAAPLSCPCVQGYAQRDYEQLGAYLEARLGRPVTVTFAESLKQALAKKGCGHADIIIGKDSVVRSGAAPVGHRVTPVARLTDKQGRTTQTGLIVVRAGDPAQGVSDLVGYRILYGPADCDEKFAAPRALLRAAGVDVPPPGKAETSAACSDGACKVIELGEGVRAAAVISSYAAPLLEGCGTIAKGELRVVAETAPVPFVTAFVTDRLSPGDRGRVGEALLGVGSKPRLLLALESLRGFVPLAERPGPGGPGVTPPPAASPPSAAAVWPGWSGPTRDGHAAWLPDSLPDSPREVWRVPLLRPGLGGIAATEEVVLFGDRDPTNQFDEWRCLDARDSGERWTITYPALGDLDYDNCPRATPLVDGDRVYLFGAFGDLHCVDVATGELVWQTNLRLAYGADHELIWGCCSSPLIVEDKLIVNPGAADAAWVALDKKTGAELWRTAGDRHAYASPILAELGGVRQLIAYDRTSLGGWDPATGRRLWTLRPPSPGDFNVPSPVVVGDRLLVVTENNGARLHAFDDAGRIDPEPLAVQRRLAPDMSTPIVVGEKIYCIWKKLVCLDAKTLAVESMVRDAAFSDFGSLIGCGDRLLTVGRGGEVLLINAAGKATSVASRFDIDAAATKSRLYSQPALVGSRLFVRGEDALVCVDLGS